MTGSTQPASSGASCESAFPPPDEDRSQPVNLGPEQSPYSRAVPIPPSTSTPVGDVVTASQPKAAEPPTVMYLVRSRIGSDSWAEWEESWDDLLRKVSERAAEQKGNHPGFDVIEVEIQQHAVVRPTVAVEDGAVIGWHDAPSAAGGTS